MWIANEAGRGKLGRALPRIGAALLATNGAGDALRFCRGGYGDCHAAVLRRTGNARQRHGRVALHHDEEARGEALGRQPLHVAEKMAMTEALALEFGRAVDLVDLQRVGEPLIGSTVQTGRQVLGERSARGDLLVRHLANQADFVPLQNRILRARRTAWLAQ